MKIKSSSMKLKFMPSLCNMGAGLSERGNVGCAVHRQGSSAGPESLGDVS